MWVRSICKHYNKFLREEDEEFEHNGALYEHIVQAKRPAADSSQQDDTVSRAMKTPAKA